MNKHFRTVILTALFAIGIGALFSTSGNAQSVGHTFSGPVFFRNANIKVDSNTVGALTKAQIANRTRYVDLPIGVWRLETDGTILTAASVPGIVKIHSVLAAEWNVTENSQKASANFVVPADYVSGATFKCMVSLEAASTDSTFDWEIFVNTGAVAFDAATTNQTAVAVANQTTTMQELSLVTLTDTFTAGDRVQINVNRAAGTGAGSHVELYGCRLEYTADM